MARPRAPPVMRGGEMRTRGARRVDLAFPLVSRPGRCFILFFLPIRTLETYCIVNICDISLFPQNTGLFFFSLLFLFFFPFFFFLIFFFLIFSPLCRI